MYAYHLYCFSSNPVPVTRVAMGSEIRIWEHLACEIFFLPIKFRVTCLGFAKSQTIFEGHADVDSFPHCVGV